jgi:mono/diheme cytochrome c family protein
VRYVLTTLIIVLVVVLVVGIAAFMFLKFGAGGFSARAEPSAIETGIARWARRVALPSQFRSMKNPVPMTAEVLANARAHWADHCASCHANNGAGEIEMGRHMYPPAPDMRLKATQDMSDGELFYVIQNGVRFTGMPGWGGGSHHDEQDSWKLVHFIRHLPQLTAAEEREMQALNPKSPDELKEEQEEQEFLNGGPPHDHSHEQH